ncbi:MAG: hypothetical protein HZA14_00705 [Nitrospirae bacterium]|nr:hypothetical protein [Nitrospirota bacterium]
MKSIGLLSAISILTPGASTAAPYGAQWYDVSEYLLGKVYVKVIFLESNEKSPNTENWTEEEKSNCREALEKALFEIRKRFIKEFELKEGSGKLPPGVNLEFITDYETVEVSVEPVTLNGSGIVFSTGDLKLWVNEVMTKKGFNKKAPPSGPQPILPYPPYQYNVAEYADYLRNKYDTDWATVIFFYDNSNDEDGLFANKRSAGPPMGVGGPGLHFSNNRGRPFIGKRQSPEDPLSVAGMIHEFFHVWYAVDEHTSNKHFKDDAAMGYLRGENLNYGKDRGYRSVMYSAQDWPELSPYTKKQIGWTDSDGDHVPDILDVPPVITLSPDTKKGAATYKGRAFSPPLPNRNPYSEGGTLKPPHDLSVVLHLSPTPERRLGIGDLFKKVPAFQPPFPWTRNDITINKIISVEYRVMKDGKAVAGWVKAEPEDGAFDDAVEDFRFSFQTPSQGEYAVEIRALNTVNFYSDIVRIQ